MLDVENVLYAEVAKLLRKEHKGINIYGCEVDSPANFPAVAFVESDNSTYKRSLSGDNVEHNANLMYTVNVYSNLQDAAGKQECKDILTTVDRFMREKGFIRTTNMPLSNVDKSISRRVARYTGIIGEDNLIYKS